MPTQQELFDRAYKHLLTQKKQALGPMGNCQYLTYDGLKCAVGGLLSDRALRLLQDCGRNGSSVSELRLVEDELGLGLGLSDNEELLKSLQCVHDTYQPFEWVERLALVAKHYGLTIPEMANQ